MNISRLSKIVSILSKIVSILLIVYKVIIFASFFICAFILDDKILNAQAQGILLGVAVSVSTFYEIRWIREVNHASD